MKINSRELLFLYLCLIWFLFIFSLCSASLKLITAVSWTIPQHPLLTQRCPHVPCTKTNHSLEDTTLFCGAVAVLLGCFSLFAIWFPQLSSVWQIFKLYCPLQTACFKNAIIIISLMSECLKVRSLVQGVSQDLKLTGSLLLLQLIMKCSIAGFLCEDRDSDVDYGEK